MSSYRDIAGTAVLSFGTATFLSGREDAIAVFLGFILLGLMMLYLIHKVSERIHKQILTHQEAQMKAMRSHIARFYILQRRKNRNHEFRIHEMEDVYKKVDALDRNCVARTGRVDNYYKMVGVLQENQRALESHFNFRVSRIEDKLMIAHDKAVARLALKGVIDVDKKDTP